MSAHADRAAVEAFQLERLNLLLTRLVPSNAFWTARLEAAGIDGVAGVASLDEFRAKLPLLEKHELAEDQLAHPPYGTNLTYPLERYVRLHQTSSTTGDPLRWLDTAEDWEGMCAGWLTVWRELGMTAEDRLLAAFSFGPFLGFWLGWDAAQELGALCIPGGGLDSKTRLRIMQRNEVTVLACTPTYALRLGQVACEEGVDSGALPLRAILVGGEPGGSVSSVRARIEELWGGATVHDHSGMTEVGPMTYQVEPGLLELMENDYLVEVVDPESGEPLEPGAGDGLGELIVSNLGRTGRPLLRYRTRDLVRPAGYGPPPRPFLRLDGGVRARLDQMVVVRGVNVFPSAIDEVVGAVNGVAEYRVEVDRSQAMVELRLAVEPDPGAGDGAALGRRLEEELRSALGLRVPVTLVGPGELPRFELKAKRWVELG